MSDFPVLQTQASPWDSFPPASTVPTSQNRERSSPPRWQTLSPWNPPAFAENPFARDERATSVCVTCLVWSRKAVSEEKLMELQHSSILRGRHQEERADSLISCLLNNTHVALFLRAQKILACFGSALVWRLLLCHGNNKIEAAVPVNDLRVATTEQQPHLNVLETRLQTALSLGKKIFNSYPCSYFAPYSMFCKLWIKLMISFSLKGSWINIWPQKCHHQTTFI